MSKRFSLFVPIFLWAALVCLTPISKVLAQSIGLHYPVYDDYMRRQQLLGNLSEESSFMIRPILPKQVFNTTGAFNFEQNSRVEEKNLTGLASFDEVKFMTLPVMIKSRYNSNLPFGINDGEMIPNKGLQLNASLGIYFEYGPLTLQLQPEILHAANSDFTTFPLEHWGSTWLQYFEWVNTADIPERFDGGPITRLSLGQSSLRFNFKEYSIGISNENLWWGPGRRASLLMSNNAPGFLHFTFNTRKPVKTVIGSFEGQLIAGQLRSSGVDPVNSYYTYTNTPLYVPKRADDDWRYLSGLTISYQPKWLPGLFLGFSSVSQMYHTDLDQFADYLPVFNGEKGPESITKPNVDQRNQLSSGQFRWINSNGHFEFYGEYGSNGNSRTLHDFLINPDKNRAFTFGFTNLTSLKKKDEFFQLGMEMTQTGQSVREEILSRNSWYTHPYVRHGYTHKGQVLGFGYGPGSSVLSFDMAWVKNFNRIGIEFEYINYNNDFYYKRFEVIKDLRRKYVDLAPAIVGEWRFDKLLVSANFKYVRSLNYKWYLENDPDDYFIPGLDKDNFVGNLSFSYIID
ncbi:capsule assembly Wzi family protein [uncultured Cyclobacterium sp.]|uniref:capsule assembly Wzi family protein n=1 Tax=uncultured Cyclobacterium sp. TaxID=453820 RepID=UPI0030ED1EC5